MRTTARLLVAALGGTMSVALAVGSAAWAEPAPTATAAVAGGGLSAAGLRVGGALTGDDPVSFVVDLAFRDEPGAEAAAIAAATPGSPTHGRFLTSAGFDARYGPRSTDVSALRTWLTRKGLTVDADAGNQALVVHGDASRVSAAFGGVALRSVTALGAPTRTAAGVLATGPLRLPTALAAAVAGIGGLGGPTPAAITDSYVSDPDPRVGATGATAAATTTPCAAWFGQTKPALAVPLPFTPKLISAPECSYFPGGKGTFTAASTAKLRKLDNFNPRYLGAGTTVGVVLWGNDAATKQAANLQARLNGVTVLRRGQYTSVLTRTRVPGCAAVTSDVHLEQNLDVQAVRTMAPAAKIRYYADTRCQTPELSLARAVAQDKVQVLTNSWGLPNREYDPRNPGSRYYALGDIVHKSLVKAAAEGITVLFASGDSGSGVLAHTSPHGSPQYPASDPFAVAVGGVGFGTNSSGGVAFRSGWTDAEFVLAGGRWQRMPSVQAFGPNGIGSTGGVSHIWAAPSWQRRAHVAVRGKRVVPDLANAADGFFNPFLEVQFVFGIATPEAVAGTSVAAPLTAGQVAGALGAVRGHRLGLITPALYAGRKKGVVTDVFFRQDAVVTTLATGQPVAFGEEVPGEKLRSRAGWDDVTGLGTPGPRFYSLIRK